MARRFARVTMDASGLERMLTRSGGPGAQTLQRVGNRIADLARINGAGNGTIPRYIYVGPPEGKTIKVISSNPHTMLVHNGSRRHPIVPRRPVRPGRRGPYLRFVVGGRVVYARRVDHPGYRGNPFLLDALRQA